jgi:hypothetical protein
LLLSGLFACMLFSNNDNTAAAQQPQQVSPNLAQNTTTNASNTLSLTGTATTMINQIK